ncbi:MULTISPECIES: hypothetical protein [Nostocales]|uniref:Uncharacterized protein n=3 Tax=Nostocales TaxID=1161 RepID=A0A8S9TBI5_9CYAN|nr:hypothetical protein [Tolypothrix bouteillei]KAF3889921.1 hypothetical protein DA73_0400033965 [Tolypothrix bouteillei VB521301]
MFGTRLAIDGLVVTRIIHTLNQDSVNYPSFQSPTNEYNEAKVKRKHSYVVSCLVLVYCDRSLTQ